MAAPVVPGTPGRAALDGTGWVGPGLVSALTRAVSRDPGLPVEVLACILFPAVSDPLPATQNALHVLNNLYAVRDGRVYPR